MIVADLDDFVARLETVQCYVTCSSGTTGEPATIPCSATDLDIASQSNVHGLSWATGIAPEGDRKFCGLGPHMAIERNERTRLAMIDAFSSPQNSYQLPLAPITVGSIMGMITFRRRIADGTASPSEVAAFEQLRYPTPSHHGRRGRGSGRRAHRAQGPEVAASRNVVVVVSDRGRRACEGTLRQGFSG